MMLLHILTIGSAVAAFIFSYLFWKFPWLDPGSRRIAWYFLGFGCLFTLLILIFWEHL